MNFIPIIGFAGRAGAGKDTAAAHLVAKYGYIQYRFADPIKKLINERFDFTPEQWEKPGWKDSPHPDCGYRDAIGPPFSPRSWAQWLGTEVGRTISPDVWVDLMEKKFHEVRDYTTKLSQFPNGHGLVISDVRFLNEATRIRKLGGAIIHIVRPGTDTPVDHISEAGFGRGPNDPIVFNTGSIELLQESLDGLLKVMSLPKPLG